jgi:hypothetical protein
MNFKTIIVLGLSIATLGLSLPAHAGDTATVVDSSQDLIVTGERNVTSQSNSTRVNNRQTGRKTTDATGTSVTNTQIGDVEGKNNLTEQVNETRVENYKRRTR